MYLEEASFIERINRFTARVELNGRPVICHVKNTGRCRELFLPGARVLLKRAENPDRKTGYDLLFVYKNERLISVDSTAPNRAVRDFLQESELDGERVSNIRPETRFGSSRLDFSFERGGRQCFMEVKGVTLERERIAYFPDAPTLRGLRHIYELIEASRQGFGAYILFVVQMEGVERFRPNDETQPEFGKALAKARENGVRIIAMDCRVREKGIVLNREIPCEIGGVSFSGKGNQQ